MTAVAERRRGLLVWQLALAAAVLLAWEWATASTLLDPFFFSRPSDIARRLAHRIATGSLWPHVATTFIEAVLAFSIGAVLGVLLGLALAVVPMLSALLEPYIRVANALPRVVLAPIFLLWFRTTEVRQFSAAPPSPLLGRCHDVR